jgi:hypothetical protein
MLSFKMMKMPKHCCYFGCLALITNFFELNRDIFLVLLPARPRRIAKRSSIHKDLINTNQDLKGKWSEITIETIASKYLTVLKLKLLEGTKKKKFL